jgi:hypothetical protein
MKPLEILQYSFYMIGMLTALITCACAVYQAIAKHIELEKGFKKTLINV